MEMWSQEIFFCYFSFVVFTMEHMSSCLFIDENKIKVRENYAIDMVEKCQNAKVKGRPNIGEHNNKKQSMWAKVHIAAYIDVGFRVYRKHMLIVSIFSAYRKQSC